MAAVANATGLKVAPQGLMFPPCGTDELAIVLSPPELGGQLHAYGQVEVISSLYRDGRPVERDLRWGVFVTFEAPSDYAAHCLGEYGLSTDATGRISAMYKPYHLIGLELGISVASAALRNEPTGSATDFVADVVTVAKRDLKMGEILDGEGGFTVRGQLMPSADSLTAAALPLGLAHDISIARPVKANQSLSWDDVVTDPDDDTVRTRREMEMAFALQ